MGKLATALVLIFTYSTYGSDTPCKALGNSLSHQTLEARYLNCLMRKNIMDCRSNFCKTDKIVNCLEHLYRYKLKTFLKMKKRNCFHQQISFRNF